MTQPTQESKLIGWREWVRLPDIGIEHMTCKVDTGAKNSALHAFQVEPFDKEGEAWVRFWIHTTPDDPNISQICEAKIVDQREVTDSSGNTSLRYFIDTTIEIGNQSLKVPMSLTARDTMAYKMLLGRTAIRKAGYWVDPEHSYLQKLQGAPK